MSVQKLRSENNWLKSGLVFAVIIILLFKDKIKEYFCSCELNKPEDLGGSSPEDPGFIHFPDFSSSEQQAKTSIDVELFERSEDSNILNYSETELSAAYNYGTDQLEIIKLLRNG